jgi:hypothetical protein
MYLCGIFCPTILVIMKIDDASLKYCWDPVLLPLPPTGLESPIISLQNISVEV